MRETHVPLESVWERLVRAVEEGSKRPSKSLKGSKLRRTLNLTFSKTGLKLHTKTQWLRLSLRNIEYATNTYKKYFYTFRINHSTFTYGESNEERPNFYGMFSQSLPISAAFTAILKMKLPQCNAIGVRTPPGLRFHQSPETFRIITVLKRLNMVPIALVYFSLFFPVRLKLRRFSFFPKAFPFMKKATNCRCYPRNCSFSKNDVYWCFY